jgi:hypothetical protein
MAAKDVAFWRRGSVSNVSACVDDSGAARASSPVESMPRFDDGRLDEEPTFQRCRSSFKARRIDAAALVHSRPARPLRLRRAVPAAVPVRTTPANSTGVSVRDR